MLPEPDGGSHDISGLNGTMQTRKTLRGRPNNKIQVKSGKRGGSACAGDLM